MPGYLHWFLVDWRWKELTEEERQVVRRYEAVLQTDPQSATSEWLVNLLAEASSRLPEREILSALEGDDGDLYLLRAASGEARLLIPDQELAAVFERISTTAAKELFPESLKAADFRAVGAEKVARGHSYYSSVIEEIQHQATEADRSLSYVVQQAWTLAAGSIRALENRESFLREWARLNPESPSAEQRRQTIHFPLAMLVELEERARQLECSQSELLQLAWLLRREKAATLPAT